MHIIYNDLKQIQESLNLYLSSTSDDIASIAEAYLNESEWLHSAVHILAAGMCGSKKQAHEVAAILEYVNTASAIHGAVALRADKYAEKNNIKILSGDYLYTSAFLLLIDLPDREYARLITKAVTDLTEADALLNLKNKDCSISLEDYEGIIYGRTASLFSASCECAAVSSDAGEIYRNNLRDFGRNFGYIIHIKNDMRASEAKWPNMQGILLRDEVYAQRGGVFNPETACKLAEEYGIPQKMQDMVNLYSNKALSNLDVFKDSNYKKALIELVDSYKK